MPVGYPHTKFTTGPIVERWFKRLSPSYTLWKVPPMQKEQTVRNNLRWYRAIRDAWRQGYPGQPIGRATRHCPPRSAQQWDRGESEHAAPLRAIRVPDAEVLLAPLALQTLGLVLDSHVVGRGYAALLIHVGYHGRALRWRGSCVAGSTGTVLRPCILP